MSANNLRSQYRRLNRRDRIMVQSFVAAAAFSILLAILLTLVADWMAR